VALGWMVVQLAVRDGVPALGPFYIGLVGLSRALPSLAFGLVGGVLADRFDRRALLMVTQLAGGLTAALLAVLTLADRIDIVAVMVLSVLGATANAFDLPGRNAAIPRLVPERDLMSAIALYTATFNGALVVGPIVAGLLIEPIGVGGLMVLNALSFLATTAALLVMRPMPPSGPAVKANVFGSMVEGLRYIRDESALRWVIVLSTATCLVARPLSLLLPAFAHDTLRVGAVELAWLTASYGIGCLVGALGTASFSGVRRRGLALAGSLLALGLFNVAFAAQRALLPALLLVALPGVTQFIFSGIANAILQTRTPDQLRGRVMGVYTMTFQGVIPFGSMVLGSLGALIGIDLAVALGGALLAVAAGYVLLRVEAVRLIGSNQSSQVVVQV
jgi:MFS family permease